MSEANKDLKRFTYRGVQMFYRGTSEDFGFKTATHEYPGSDNFTVEQLGKKGRVFKIDAEVEVAARDQVDNALNTPGRGLLSHPLYGTFIVKVGEYSKNDSPNQLGYYSYSIQFFVEIGLIVPSLSSISASLISNGRSKVLESTVDYVNNRIKTTF